MLTADLRAGTGIEQRLGSRPAQTVAVGLLAFLTLVDLFAAQALLPALARRYAVDAAAMGVAVNACTFGMAVSSLAVAFLSHRLERRRGIWISLALLSLPTLLLAVAPSLFAFALLRVTQGIFMAAAFALTLAHLGEHFSGRNAAGFFAAYVTGNVASNLVGRLAASAMADHFGVASAFCLFAALNIAGALLAWRFVARPIETSSTPPVEPVAAQRRLRALGDPALLASFGIGFCILFAFIGTYTYVNFVLVAAPFDLGMMSLGFIYFVFLPAIITTPLGGRVVQRVGARAALWLSLALAGCGLPLVLSGSLPPVLLGLALIGVGTFLAQAAATSFVGATSDVDRGTASGLYLASYFLGGLVGSAVLGQLFVRYGWPACVAGITAALALAALLTCCLPGGAGRRRMLARHGTDRQTAMESGARLRQHSIIPSFC